MATTLIDRLNAIIETGEVSRSGLARAAGLHPNSLRKLGQPDWNPTADTLGRLEKLLARGTTEVLVGPETIIDEARNGRMFILVDDDDRENEGDLVIPAQMATPDAINFMARHGRGLICLALTKDRVDQLGLPLMSRNNGTRHETAFTVSIEARTGVSTGITVPARSLSRSMRRTAPTTSSHPGTSSHWSRGPEASWSALAIRRRRWTSAAWLVSILRA
jgi:3,4-dihydroxy 2-butanone 4-phosphate synthase/GTP cyclohydrolase II